MGISIVRLCHKHYRAGLTELNDLFANRNHSHYYNNKSSLLPGNHHIKPYMNVLKLNPLSLSVELAIKQLLALFYSRIAQGRWLFAKMSAIRFRRQKASFAATNLMQEKSDFYDKPCPIRIEIDPEKIQLLLANRQLCAADFHCLDQASHRCIRELCLKTCLHPLGHN